MTSGLSVVIAARNAAQTVGEQLDALVTQPWPDGGEIILADNGSSDATAQIAATYSNGPIPVRVVDCGETLGAGFARNSGVEAASFDSIAFCDADDAVGSGWVASIGDALKTAPAVGGRLDFERLNPSWVAQSRGRHVTADALPLFDDTFPVLSSCNMGIDRAAFLSLGGFDPRFLRGQDAELSLRLHEAEIAATYVDSAVVYYRFRSSLGAIFRQAKSWGHVQVVLRELLSSTTTPDRALQRTLSIARSWVWLVRYIHLLGSRAGRARWSYVAGIRIGALHAQIERRFTGLAQAEQA